MKLPTSKVWQVLQLQLHRLWLVAPSSSLWSSLGRPSKATTGNWHLRHLSLPFGFLTLTPIFPGILQQAHRGCGVNRKELTATVQQKAYDNIQLL